MNNTGMGYDTVLVLHVLAGFVGFASLGMTGYYAARARREPESAAVRRYFRPGINWAERVVFLVPLLGLVLLYMAGDPGGEAREHWVLAGFVLWCVAAALAAAVQWPAEHRIQQAVAALGEGEGKEEGGAAEQYYAIHSAGKQITRAATVADVLYVVALWVMVAKPA